MLLLLIQAPIRAQNFLILSIPNAIISGFRYVEHIITRKGDIESPLFWWHITVCLEECSIVEGVGDESWDLFLFKNGNLRRILSLGTSLPLHLSQCTCATAQWQCERREYRTGMTILSRFGNSRTP